MKVNKSEDNKIFDADYPDEFFELLDSTVPDYEHAYGVSCSSSNSCSDPIALAKNECLVDKRRKIELFFKENADTLENHLEQLYSFATSSNGLIEDKYREKIWPILSKKIPSARKLDKSDKLFRRYVKKKGFVPVFVDDEHFENFSDDDNSKSSDVESNLESPFSSINSRSGEEGNDENEDPHKNDLINPTLEQLNAHKEWNQVELDVNRTLARFPPHITEEERLQLQRHLTPLIVRVLCKNDNFRYYQGFHDVCLTFLLVLGFEEATNAMNSLVDRGVFYNYLSNPLEKTVIKELDFLYVLLYQVDPELEELFRKAYLGTLFALSWPLTWFSHVVQNYSQITAIFDFLLCSGPLMSIYISTSLVVERRKEILNCEPDMPYLHKLLCEVPESIDFHSVLERAKDFHQKYPPKVLEFEKVAYKEMCTRFINRNSEGYASLAVRRPRPIISRYNLFTIAAVAGAVAYMIYNNLTFEHIFGYFNVAMAS